MPTRAEKPTTDEIAAAVESIGDEQLTALFDQWMELTEAQADIESELFTRITQLTGAADEDPGDEESADGDESSEEDDTSEDDDAAAADDEGDDEEEDQAA